MEIEKPPVVIGEVLPNGGTVLAYKWRPHTKGEVEGQHGVVLCLVPGNYHPFVVWSFVKEPDKEINCFAGDYWMNIDAAYRVFRIRAKKIY